MKHSLRLIALLGGFSLAACATNNTGPGTTTVASIVVTPNAVRLLAPDSVLLSATPLDNQGHLVSGISITFGSANPAVATVSNLGVVNAVAHGSTTITVSGGGATGHASIIVNTDTQSPLAFRPFGVAISAGGIVYVTQLDNASVARASLPDTAFTTSVNVGTVPTSVTFNSAGTTAYVTNQADFTVGVINVASGTETTTLTPPGNSNTAVVRSAPSGNLLWVSTTADSLFGINEATNGIVYRFGTGGWANGIAFTPANDSLVFVGVQSGTALEINYKKGTILHTFNIGGHPQGIAVSKDGKELYVADEASDSLHIWSLASLKEVGTVVLAGSAFDVMLSPDGKELWVSVIGAGDVQVVNRQARTIEATYPVGGTVRRIAITANGTTAVIANEGGWVDFIQ